MNVGAAAREVHSEFLLIRRTFYITIEERLK